MLNKPFKNRPKTEKIQKWSKFAKSGRTGADKADPKRHKDTTR